MYSTTILYAINAALATIAAIGISMKEKRFAVEVYEWRD